MFTVARLMLDGARGWTCRWCWRERRELQFGGRGLTTWRCPPSGTLSVACRERWCCVGWGDVAPLRLPRRMFVAPWWVAMLRLPSKGVALHWLRISGHGGLTGKFTRKAGLSMARERPAYREIGRGFTFRLRRSPLSQHNFSRTTGTAVQL